MGECCLPFPSPLLWVWVVVVTIILTTTTTIAVAAKPVDILRGSTITLLPFSSFDNPNQECTDRHITQAQVNSFIFPKTATSTKATRSSFFVEIAPVCPSAKGSVLSLDGFNLKVACRPTTITSTNTNTTTSTTTALVVSLEEIIQPGSRLVILATRTINNFTNGRTVTIIININQSSSTASLCVDGSLVKETATTTTATDTTSQRAVMERVLLGARAEKLTTARAEVLNFFISSSSSSDDDDIGNGVSMMMPCNTTAAMLRREAQSSNSQAAITAFQQVSPSFSQEDHQDDKDSRDVFINEDVTFSLSAALEYTQQQLQSSSSSSSSLLTLSMQFYGLVEDDCNGEECRNKLIEQTFPISPTSKFNTTTLTATVKYPQAGRFTIRARVINSNSNGQLIQQDRHIIVRKIGDIAAAAPCCRTTSLVTAQQLGRPISNTYFRSSLALSTSAIGGTTGWSDDENYWNGADLESERLFDFSILAPPLERIIIIIGEGGGGGGEVSLLDMAVSCHHSKLAGPGSPTLYGATPSSRRQTQGHNKQLVIVPAGFGWANASQVDCQKHWSGWPSSTTSSSSSSSSYMVLNSKGEECSTACTKQGTEFFISETGMFDQVNQAIITASYGQLSLNSAPLILPEVLIPSEYPSQQYILDYYEAPARKAIAAANTSYWSYLVLVPTAKHREPPIRAWSAGMTRKNAVITHCYASMYYSIHELGHRLGFRHANVYQLASSATGTGAAITTTSSSSATITTQATADPLGKGTANGNGYSDALDIMSCCRSDYGLYHRLMAGWLSGKNERIVISASSSSLSTPSSSVKRHDAILWPFDRSESKGNLMSITIRLSPDDILIIGARSASHWPDMSLTDPGWNGSPIAPASIRTNIAGVGVWLVRREEAAGDTSGGRKVWGDAAMLDYNVLHRDWPGALPAANGQLARQSEFALLKDGYSWYYPGSKVLLAVEGTKDCLGTGGTSGSSTVYSYSAKAYYGYRGEGPGRESFRQADYSGFQTLKCSKIVIKTGTPPPPKENMEAKVQSVGQSAASCSALSVGLSWPGDVKVSSVVWKDALNNTVWQYIPSTDGSTSSSSSDDGISFNSSSIIAELPVMELTLPPTEYTRPTTTTSPVSSPPTCRGSDCPKEPRFYGHILFDDGRHTAVNLVFNNNGIKSGKVTVNTRYYAVHQVTTVTEVMEFDGFSPCPAVEASAGRDDNGGESDEGEEKEEEESKLRVYIIGVSIAGGALVALVSTIVLIAQYRKTKKEKKNMKIESIKVAIAP